MEGQIIDKNFIRSDQPPEESKDQPRSLEIDAGANPESMISPRTDDSRRSPGFVKIDLYGQDRSEYVYTSLLTGLIQVPILITIHELLNVRKQVNSYTIAYGIAFVQLVTMIIYFKARGLFFFDVP